MTRIRPATIADAEAIASVHVQAWRETYPGLIPDSTLAGLSVEQRVRAWSQMLSAGQRAPGVVVAEQGDRIVGFGSARAARDPLLTTDGEVTAIYLLDGSKRQGIGRAIFRQLTAWLHERNFVSMGLWVLTTNAGARGFYEAMGGRTGPTKEDVRPDVTLHEVAYIWDRLGQDGP